MAFAPARYTVRPWTHSNMSGIPVRMCVVRPKVPASFCNPHHEEEVMPRNDTLNLIHPRAAGLDVQRAWTYTRCRSRPACVRPGAEAAIFTRIFGALPSGRRELVAWLLEHRVPAAVMEGTGVYW